jgi:quercetin dioxygenase-like cupin family protein
MVGHGQARFTAGRFEQVLVDDDKAGTPSRALAERPGDEGKEVAEHKAKGEIVVQCLEGRVAFTALGRTQTLEAGKLLYLPSGEPHSVKGIDNASLLLTILLPKH